MHESPLANTDKRQTTYHPNPSKPRFAMPADACDTHCHVFGPTRVFPFAADAPFLPGDATKEQLFGLRDMLGIERCVIVQSGCHGFDNSAVADAIAARPENYLGIALAPVSITDQAIQALADQGFRGIRFNYFKHLKGGPDMADLRRLAQRLQRFDWHLQLHVESELLESMMPTLVELPVPVVIDHMTRIDASAGSQQHAFQVLQPLLEHHHLWVKMSALERASRTDPPWHDALPFAKTLVETFPDRVLWGTDWPHPNFRAAPPDDGSIVDLIPFFAVTPALRQALLVDNPTRSYQFT